jgi:hypothetical protein
MFYPNEPIGIINLSDLGGFFPLKGKEGKRRGREGNNARRCLAIFLAYPITLYPITPGKLYNNYI